MKAYLDLFTDDLSEIEKNTLMTFLKKIKRIVAKDGNEEIVLDVYPHLLVCPSDKTVTAVDAEFFTNQIRIITEHIPVFDTKEDEPSNEFSWRPDIITWSTRGKATQALNELCRVLEDYGKVCVCDLLDIADYTRSSAYYVTTPGGRLEDWGTDYGWTNLENAKVKRVSNMINGLIRYYISLPNPIKFK